LAAEAEVLLFKSLLTGLSRDSEFCPDLVPLEASPALNPCSLPRCPGLLEELMFLWDVLLPKVEVFKLELLLFDVADAVVGLFRFELERLGFLLC